MKKLLKKLFNTNTGHFLKEVIYDYNGKPYVGYVLCRGYVMFGIFGYDKIHVTHDLVEAKEVKKFYKNLSF